MVEEFSNEFPISMALFMELFCSIHMSAFVLFPLAEHINPDKKTSLFCKFFTIRAAILIIGNFITTFIAILDFIMIFIMAFIVLPVLKGLKKEKHNELGKMNYQEDDVPFESNNNFDEDIKTNSNVEEELEKMGIYDLELLKKELYRIFVNYKVHYSNQNLEMIAPLCEEKFLENINRKLNFIKEKEYREISKNFTLSDAQINSVSINEVYQMISITFKVCFTYYLMDNNEKILRGSRFELKNTIFNVSFQREKQNYNKNNRNCPSCGAPVMPYDLTCDYCMGTISNNGDWRISSIEEYQ